MGQIKNIKLHIVTDIKKMFAKSVLITGANRGVGLEFVRQLADKTQHLFAACRKPSEAIELQKIADQHNHVHVVEMDVTNEGQIAACACIITETVGDDGLSCIINNAGQIHRGDLENTTAEDMRRIYAVNVIGPAMVVKAHLPLLKKASACFSHTDMSVSRGHPLNISSKVGSITDNSSGGKYAYRMSKAALNMLTKNLSIELKKDHILAVNIHPGWVQTEMGGTNALISVEQSVTGMLSVVSTFTEEHNGGFYGWNGENIPW